MESYRVIKKTGGHYFLSDSGTVSGISAHLPEIKRLRTLQQVKLCRHLGPVLGPVKAGCGICGDRYFCSKFGETTLVYCRETCQAYESKLKSGKPKELPPAEYRYARNAIKITPETMSPETGGVRLNPSLIRNGAGYLFVYRNRWDNSAISVIRLDHHFHPIGTASYLSLNHYQATMGREDPRLFRYRGKVHVSFTGWLGEDTIRWNQANMLYARLSDQLEVDRIYFPDIPGRASWEKNHVYFENDGKLYLIYSISPHIVFQVDDEKILERYETDTETEWNAGHLRGGCSPVLHQGKYYHFFHGTADKPTGGRVYSLGLAVFEAKLPFRILKITHFPLDAGDPVTNPGITSDVIFPGGAVYLNGMWAIAMGVHDKWSEIRFYPEKYVEQSLSTI